MCQRCCVEAGHFSNRIKMPWRGSQAHGWLGASPGAPTSHVYASLGRWWRALLRRCA